LFFSSSLPTTPTNEEGIILPEPGNAQNYCGRTLTNSFKVRNQKQPKAKDAILKEEAQQGAYPFIAALGKRNERNLDKIIYPCVGSLITRKYVLTAAHCHKDDSPIVEVLLGEYDFSRDPDCEEGNCLSSK
jgi:secreted trypsin-like serine protease